MVLGNSHRLPSSGKAGGDAGWGGTPFQARTVTVPGRRAALASHLRGIHAQFQTNKPEAKSLRAVEAGGSQGRCVLVPRSKAASGRRSPGLPDFEVHARSCTLSENQL